MASPTLDSTVSGASSNSYVSRAAAQTYFDGRLNADNWQNGATADQDRSLMMATVYLERYEYLGTITSTSQRLKWPRSGLIDEEGRSVSSSAIPNAIAEATYELALAFLDGKLYLQDDGIEQYESVSVGPISVTGRLRDATTMPNHVRNLIDWLLLNSASGLTRPLVRG